MEKYQKQLRGIEIEMRELLGKAQTVTGKAAGEGRGMTDDENAEVQAHLKQVGVLEGLKAEVEASIATVARVQSIGDAIVVDEDKSKGTASAPRAKSIGEAFTDSVEFKARRGTETGPIQIEAKAVVSEAVSGAIVAPDYQPGILPILTQPLRVADLIAQGTTSSNLVRYMQEEAETNAAAGVHESGLKPEASMTFETVDAAVKKIAVFLPITDEMLEDVPALQSYINGRLSLFVKIEEERQLLHGSGGDQLSGILGQIPGDNQGVTSDVADAQAADHIFAAITVVRDSFIEPDAVVINNDDWATVQLLKDSQGRYLGAGPFNTPVTPNIWGKPVAVTAAMDAGTALVGAFQSGAQVFRKGGLTLESSNSHADFFQRNKTAIRVEERLALAVYRPAAFATADVSGS